MSWLDGEPNISQIFSTKLINLLGKPRGKRKINQFHMILRHPHKKYLKKLH